jgi:hypothetical protein
MTKFRRVFVYAAAALGLLTFGACSNSGNDSKVDGYSGNSQGGGPAGGASGSNGSGPGAQGGVGAINGVGGALGGVGGSGGSSAGSAGAGGSGGMAMVIDNCPGMLDAAAANGLKTGGTPDASMKFLYPYDKTVFPRGLAGPTLQWAGPAAQAVYVHIKSNGFEYHGCFGPTNPLRIQLPDNVWNSLTTYAYGPMDPVNVEIKTASNGRVSGPLKQVWEIAQGTLNGAIYYNTYGSKLGQAAGNGAVMRLIPGRTMPEVYLTEARKTDFGVTGPCKSCHSLSANGKSMVVARHQYGLAGQNVFYESYSYDISANPNPNPPPLNTATLDAAAFAAIYPDGSRFLTNGSPGTTNIIDLFPLGQGNVGAMEGPRESRLFTIAGQQLTPQGWNVKYAKMPSFSPDGKKIVFNNHDVGAGHSLSIMDFDVATNTFSNHVEIFKHDTLWPGWGFFTPDNRGVIFILTASPYYAGWVPLPGYQVEKSDLYYVDIASKRAIRMARVGDTVAYPGRDEHLDYFPTMSPVAAGGYFWAFFTSRRNYGNLMVEADLTQPHTKQIWGVAIDINAAAGADPSHPAFYLTGQELESGNVRAFAALEPCKNDGLMCTAGVECCCGGCTDGKCGCPKGCSKVQEKCVTKADCCDMTDKVQCINGFCSIVVKPPL